MPSVKASKVSAKADISIQIVRKSFDYLRDELTVVYAVSVAGLDGLPEKAVKYSLSEMRKAFDKQDDAFNAGLIREAIRRKLLPDGAVS